VFSGLVCINRYTQSEYDFQNAPDCDIYLAKGFLHIYYSTAKAYVNNYFF
jgi:hypothetical protein